MSSLPIALSTAFAAVTLWSTVCVVNHMNRKTPFLRRLAFVLLGTGAAGALIAPFYLQRSPTVGDVLMLLALALMSWTERRRFSRRDHATSH